jgi:two-component sensor histidine kinase
MLYPTQEDHDYVGREKYRQIREKGTGTVETHWLCKDGRIIDVLLSSTPIDPENWEKGVTFTATDITQQKENAARIAKDLEEKKILLKELYHRTKNNMQVIASLLNLQAMHMGSPEFTRASQEIVDKIVAMSMVHQKLYESQTLSEINLEEYLRDLVTHLIGSLNNQETSIDAVFNLTSIYVTIEEAIPLGLVITELVSNSLKHAFPAGESGIIEIGMEWDAERRIRLEYRDNGIGITPGTNLREADSMGMTTIFNLIEYQLKGSVVYEARDGLRWLIGFDSPELKASHPI